MTFGDVEEVRPAGKIREVEVQVIGLSQRVEVGGVEFEDVGGVEGSQGSHPAGSYSVPRYNILPAAMLML